MNITSGAASAGGLTFAKTLQLRAAVQQAAEARKAQIDTDKTRAMASPAFKGPETQKQQAKAKLQQIMEWLKIVKKLYANDPKGMAKALAQVFKDLKSAVKAYRAAGGQEMAMSGEAAGGVSSPAPAGPDAAKAEGDKPDEAAPGEGEPAASDAAPKEEADPAATPAQGSSIYDAVAGEMRKSIGEDGLDFIKQVRSVVNKITELLDTARGQKAIRKRDKETDKAFEEADKDLKSLHEEIDGIEQDIHREAPMAGMKLSVAA